jgi:glycosyltransferase involved in cell wall biosynthesis
LKITVAILTHNRKPFLQKALNAVLNQTYQDFDFFVLDNFSTDGTAEYVLGLNDPRLTYLRQAPNSTPDDNFCSAIWMSTTKYVLVTHDDDMLEPTCIERYISFMQQKPNVVCLASNVSIIDEHDQLVQPYLYEMKEDRIFKVGEYIGTYLKEKLWLPTPTCLWKRDAMLRIWGKNPVNRIRKRTYLPSGDILAHCNLNGFGEIALLASPLLRYRHHSGQECRQVQHGDPMVQMLKIIKKQTESSTAFKRVSPLIDSSLARFEMQQLFLRYSKKSHLPRIAQKAVAIRAKLVREIPIKKRALDSLIPFEILLLLLDMDRYLLNQHLNTLLQQEAHSAAIQGFRNWVQLLYQGKSLFQKTEPCAKIAVFGSMLVAFMIVLDAKRAGVSVTCCIETSPPRFGEEVLGSPIIPLDKIASFENDIDFVVLSSERDHEESIKKLFESQLSMNSTPIISWKQLASGITIQSKDI